MALLHVTRPVVALPTVPMIVAAALTPKRRSCASRAVGLLRRHEGDEAAFVGDVERVEPEELAGGATSSRTGTAVSSMSTERPAVSAISTSALASPPRVRSRRQWTAMPASISASTGSASGAQSLAIAELEAEPLAGRHHRDAVAGEIAADDDGVAGTDALRLDRLLGHDPADAGGVDEELVGLAAVDDLEVAGDDLDARRRGRGAHRGDHPPQRLQRKPLLQDEAGAETDRARPAHGEVVDGAVDRERPDVAAGEEERLNDVGVGGEGERPGEVEAGAVVAAVEARVAERQGGSACRGDAPWRGRRCPGRAGRSPSPAAGTGQASANPLSFICPTRPPRPPARRDSGSRRRRRPRTKPW